MRRQAEREAGAVDSTSHSTNQKHQEWGSCACKRADERRRRASKKEDDDSSTAADAEWTGAQRQVARLQSHKHPAIQPGEIRRDGPDESRSLARGRSHPATTAHLARRDSID